MRVAVVVFPGTNCELDAAHALELAGAKPELVWHRQADLDEFDGVVLPGGFAHGDYLRTGAIARFSPIMGPVARDGGGRQAGPRDLQRIPDPVRSRSSSRGVHRQLRALLHLPVRRGGSRLDEQRPHPGQPRPDRCSGSPSIPTRGTTWIPA